MTFSHRGLDRLVQAFADAAIDGCASAAGRWSTQGDRRARGADRATWPWRVGGLDRTAVADDRRGLPGRSRYPGDPGHGDRYHCLAAQVVRVHGDGAANHQRRSAEHYARYSTSMRRASCGAAMWQTCAMRCWNWLLIRRDVRRWALKHCTNLDPGPTGRVPSASPGCAIGLNILVAESCPAET